MGSVYSKDKFYQRSVKEGYRSRAAYKLLEIQKKFGIIRNGDNVVDLGSAPGSWMQVLTGLTDGIIVGIDLKHVSAVEGAINHTGDFTKPEIQERILQEMEIVNVVVCDASPKLSGQKSYDQARAIGLNEDALSFAVTCLKPGGNFVVKSFQGEMFKGFFDEMHKHFHAVKAYRARASRRGSTETYIIGKSFKGRKE